VSRHTADILFSVAGQSLVLDCPDGRPSSVTSVQCWDYGADDTAQEEACFSGAATIETNPDTTIDLISGAGEDDPTKLNVAATTGAAVGRQLLVASELGHSEWFQVAAIDAGVAVYAKHPLLNSYEATTATVQSTRVTIAIDSAWVADQSNVSPAYNPNPRYRVRWTVVVGGETKVYETAFDLVRYNAQHHVTPLDVAQRVPNWLDWLPPDDRRDQGRTLIDRAWKAFKFDLYADNKADQAIRNPEAVDEVLIAKALAMSVEDRVLLGAATGAEADTAERVYRQRYDQFFRAPVVQMDPAGGGAATVTTPTPLWRR